MQTVRFVVVAGVVLALGMPAAYAASTNSSGASKSKATSSSAKNASSSGAAKSKATSSAAKSRANSKH